jgi:stress-induced-phosphoprotein 1
MGIGKMFSDPNMFSKLAANPRTAKLLADASFMQKARTSTGFSPSVSVRCSRLVQLKLIQQNPQLAQSLLSGDPRMIDVLGALMGIDMQGFNRPEGSDEVPPGMPPSADSASSPPSSPPPSATRAPPPPAASSSKAPEPADVKMAEAEEEIVDGEDAAAKKAAEAEKKLGAEAYKKRDFATATTHFSKAWETWPKDITFLTNLGGGLFSSSSCVPAAGSDAFCLCSCIL